MTESELARFFEKVEPEPNTGCWIFVGATSWDYGYCRANGKTRRAHRAAYEHFVGPVPDGYVLDHRCRLRRCVNPDHVRPMTQRENVLRYTSEVTRCRQGHDYTPENTYTKPNGTRACRACNYARRRAWEATARGREWKRAYQAEYMPAYHQRRKTVADA